MSCHTGQPTHYAIIAILGNHDGTVKGVKYFKCKDKHGLFVHRDKIVKNPSLAVDMKLEGEAQFSIF